MAFKGTTNKTLKLEDGQMVQSKERDITVAFEVKDGEAVVDGWEYGGRGRLKEERMGGKVGEGGTHTRQENKI
jgi:hypothetical protein